MAEYRVENKTNQTIWWRDGAWLSGDLGPGESRNQGSDHDADVTMFGKDSGGNNHEWGRVWIYRDRTLEVYGDKNWRHRRS
jgi:hypothetical protein